MSEPTETKVDTGDERHRRGSDASSVSSFDSLEDEDLRPRHLPHHPPPPRPYYSPRSPPPPPPPHDIYDSYAPLAARDRRMPLVDGKAPDVLYVLKYFSRYDRLVDERLSTKPFQRVPEDLGRRKKDKKRRDDGDDKTSSVGKPIFEVEHVVDWRRPVPRPVRHGRRDARPVERPITSAFGTGGYHVEPPYSDDEGDLYDRQASYKLLPPTLFINSDHLMNALTAVTKYYPGLYLNDRPFEVKSPYRVLYHHREELARYCDNQPDTHSPEYAATTKHHIETLLHFLDEAVTGPEIRREEERHKQPVPTATYEHFWLLLKPGSVLYAKTGDVWEAFVVSKVEGGGKESSYSVVCWYLESNGHRITRFMTTFNVPRWIGAQPISSLPVVPEAYFVDDLEAQGGLPMRESLIKLGKLYWDLLKRPTYMDYEGPLVNSTGMHSPATSVTGFMSGRVICDADGFEKYFNSSPAQRNRSYSPPPVPRNTSSPSKDPLPLYGPRCSCDACTSINHLDQADGNEGPFMGFEDIDPLKSPVPTEDLFYILCKKTMPGFLLSHRQWGHLRLSSLRHVNADKDAYKYLVLDDDIKLTVRSLIGKYATSSDGTVSPWGNDFVKNKGEGRIFLLHGSPGVGKTCTAECIAELTARPLLSLTSGDLGVNDYNVEERLSYFLELGQRYGALVLLDEADVYLERRNGGDIWRNGLVSIFLRALEYYRGVLFLTTNRVRSFDPAFLSRIHVALHYKSLRDEDRERIWVNNFDRLERESAGKVHVSVAARDLVWSGAEVRCLQWNGREIRNAMQTALALAEFDASDECSDKILIGEKHIKAVVKMSKDFRDYVHDIPDPVHPHLSNDAWDKADYRGPYPSR
ncbi:ATPase family AAA domain-containing protein [Paramyrothecium foliicola]|nr:ATPase family AAA domain-containing protein [Paramyrothecium foliicola]